MILVVRIVDQSEQAVVDSQGVKLLGIIRSLPRLKHELELGAAEPGERVKLAVIADERAIRDRPKGLADPIALHSGETLDTHRLSGARAA